jgi:hypothetical protein
MLARLEAAELGWEACKAQLMRVVRTLPPRTGGYSGEECVSELLAEVKRLRGLLPKPPMEDPDLDWIDAMRRDREENPHSETNVLLAQLEAQARAIKGHREACFQKNSELQTALEEVERLRKAAVPICVGKTVIQILAEKGKWMRESGGGVIAADCLFRKDPYAEIERLQRINAAGSSGATCMDDEPVDIL